MPVHASMLPDEVQEIIGQVGPNTVGAQRLLESIGFQYSGRVDPFDGGPHYEADTDQVTFVRDTRSYPPIVGEPDDTAQPGIVAVTADRSPHFRAVWTPVQAVHAPDETQPTHVRVGEAALARLGVTTEEAHVLVALRPQRRHSDRTSRVFPPARAPTGSLRTGG